MNSLHVIGIPTQEPMEQIAQLVEEVIGTSLNLHDSMYWGGDYYSGFPARPDLHLFPNFDLLDDAPLYDDATECPLLLMLDASLNQPHEVAMVLNQRLGTECRLLGEWG